MRIIHHQHLTTATELRAQPGQVGLDAVQIIRIISTHPDLQQPPPRRLRNRQLLTTLQRRETTLPPIGRTPRRRQPELLVIPTRRLNIRHTQRNRGQPMQAHHRLLSLKNQPRKLISCPKVQNRVAEIGQTIWTRYPLLPSWALARVRQPPIWGHHTPQHARVPLVHRDGAGHSNLLRTTCLSTRPTERDNRRPDRRESQASHTGGWLTLNPISR